VLTLDQIKNVTFSKNRGGYSTTEVDDFIDQCVDTLATVLDERNTANKKMEVLADKLVEYRNEEDSIRSALVSAQRLGDTIVRESNQKAALTLEDANIKAEKILADAQEKADAVIADIANEAKAQEEELARLKREVALFKERMLSIYREHLSLIQILPEEDAQEEAEEVAAEEPIANAEPEVPTVAVEEVAEEAPIVTEEEEAAPAAEETEEPVEEEAKESADVVSFTSLVDIAEEATEPVQDEAPKSRFSNLKFGDDYDVSDEKEEKPRGMFRRKK